MAISPHVLLPQIKKSAHYTLNDPIAESTTTLQLIQYSDGCFEKGDKNQIIEEEIPLCDQVRLMLRDIPETTFDQLEDKLAINNSNIRNLALSRLQDNYNRIAKNNPSIPKKEPEFWLLYVIKCELIIPKEGIPAIAIVTHIKFKEVTLIFIAHKVEISLNPLRLNRPISVTPYIFKMLGIPTFRLRMRTISENATIHKIRQLLICKLGVKDNDLLQIYIGCRKDGQYSGFISITFNNPVTPKDLLKSYGNPLTNTYFEEWIDYDKGS